MQAHGYTPFRKDRPGRRRGGGVVIYLKYMTYNPVKITPCHHLPTIYILNVTSIFKPHAIEHLRCDVYPLHPDIIIITESWLRPDHSDGFPTFYALKTIRSHGLRGIKLFDITESFIISRIKYAAPSCQTLPELKVCKNNAYTATIQKAQIEEKKSKKIELMEKRNQENFLGSINLKLLSKEDKAIKKYHKRKELREALLCQLKDKKERTDCEKMVKINEEMKLICNDIEELKKDKISFQLDQGAVMISDFSDRHPIFFSIKKKNLFEVSWDPIVTENDVNTAGLITEKFFRPKAKFVSGTNSKPELLERNA
ncbi:hypothetical protein HELRODRAFT_162854 [Helobdella robusta]|uniref:Uncharacterized protein n=1 Tax=Helobdella robusta TaxID=6412 RepID=T1ETA2_HELRO|nr:hypothetical protein HELRODRAFT_162854 [Helobdella robusta]ESN99331.1 hypothetical protein HELRODRAFT_162854 [Helobdella robusta]